MKARNETRLLYRESGNNHQSFLTFRGLSRQTQLRSLVSNTGVIMSGLCSHEKSFKRVRIRIVIATVRRGKCFQF